MSSVRTSYKWDDYLGKDESGSGVSGEMAIEGIEDAMKVAAELAADESNTKRVDTFTKDSCMTFNDGSPHSQNFVVMAVMLAGMIADKKSEVRKRCYEMTEGVAKGQQKWWQVVGIDEGGAPIIENEEHDAIADCKLYIEGFKIKKYVKELKGAILYALNPERERNAVGSFSNLKTTNGNSYIAAAYQVMARLPDCQKEAVEAIGKIIKRVEELRGEAQESDADEHANAEAISTLVDCATIAQALLIGTSAIAYDKAKTVTTHLVTQMMGDYVRFQKEKGCSPSTPLPTIVLDITGRYLKHGNHDSKILQSMYSQSLVESGDSGEAVSLGTGKPEEKLSRDSSELLKGTDADHTVFFPVMVLDPESGVTDSLNAGHGPDKEQKYAPYRLGEYPVITMCGEGGGRKLGEINLEESLEESLEENMRGIFSALQDAVWDVVTRRFSWKDGVGWQALSRTKDKEGATRVYEIRSVVIRTRWEDADEYLTVHFYDKDDKLGLRIRGKGVWIDPFREAAERIRKRIKKRKKEGVEFDLGKVKYDLGEIAILRYEEVKKPEQEPEV
jgi:hypothetical protein